MKIFKPSDFLAVLGAMLFLVFIYLVLQHGLTTTSILGSLFTGGNNTLKTLQGR